MRMNKLIAFYFIFLMPAACAPARTLIKPSLPPAVQKPAPAVQKPAPAAPRLSPADQKAIDQLYYQAVSAYTRDDLNTAGQHLEEIFRLDPAYAPAKELREKIRLSGGKH